MIFVLNKNKQPLSPCHSLSFSSCQKIAENRKGCYSEKISIYDSTKRVEKFRNKAEFRLKIDYRSLHTGLAILNGSKVIGLAQIHHKTSIKSNMDSRRAMRKT